MSRPGFTQNGPGQPPPPHNWHHRAPSTDHKQRARYDRAQALEKAGVYTFQADLNDRRGGEVSSVTERFLQQTYAFCFRNMLFFFWGGGFKGMGFAAGKWVLNGIGVTTGKICISFPGAEPMEGFISESGCPCI